MKKKKKKKKSPWYMLRGREQARIIMVGLS